MGKTAALLSVGVLYTVGAERPVGASMGVSVEHEGADYSGRFGPADKPPPPPVAGVVGAGLRVELRSMRVPWLFLGSVVGVAGPVIGPNGWTPVWEGLAEVGMVVSRAGAGLHTGLRAYKDASACFAGCEGAPLGLGLGVGFDVVGSDGQLSATAPTASLSGTAVLSADAWLQ